MINLGVPLWKPHMSNPSIDHSWDQPGNAGENLSIVQFPTFHLLRLASVARNSSLRNYLEPFGLTYPEWRMVTLLADFSPVAFGEITRKTMMDKGQVSRTLRTLEKRGLLTIDSGQDNRPTGIHARVVVSMSALGRTLYEAVMPVACAHQAKLIGCLTIEERQIFLSVIAKLNQFLAGEAEAR